MSWSQCAVTSAPNNNCAYYGMQIVAFSLNSIASNNAGCSPNGYGSFTSPVRTLILGNTYNWTAQTGTGYYSLGFAIWIDLDNDGFFAASEMVAVSTPAVSHAGTLTIPLTATPGSGRKMRIRSGYYSYISGSQACTNYLGGYGETEDYLVDLVSPTPCAGAPAASSVVGPTVSICPGAAAQLSLSPTYTSIGYTYQWYSSTTSNVGPFTAIPGATTSAVASPTLGANTYYMATITCTNSNLTTSATAAGVMMQGVTIDQVPYYEGFEGIQNNNDLPNCSWTSNNPGTTCRTYTTTYNQQRYARTGSKFASFYYFPSDTNLIFTNGIQLYAGVTYSAGLWYKTNYYGDLNWSNMAIMLGSSQSQSGLTTIVSTNGPAASTSYKALGSTFTVATSGIYYVGVRGVSSGGCCAYHLNWDDLSITAPCSLNTPTVNVSVNNATVCSGDAISLNASGATTYTWNTGAVGNTLSLVPSQSDFYSVTATDTLSKCTNTANVFVTVLQSPAVSITSAKNTVCSGSPIQLMANGAQNYTWGNGSNAQSITANPTSATVYSVIGVGANGCSKMATFPVNVNQLPTVSVTSDRTDICRGESETLTGGGATTYQWMSNTIFLAAPQVVVTPNATTTYTVVGTDNNGCSNSTNYQLSVSECLGINSISYANGGIKLYPNPTNSSVNIEFATGDKKQVVVTDLTGRVIFDSAVTKMNVSIDLTAYASGVYYVKVQSESINEVIKVVKE